MNQIGFTFDPRQGPSPVLEGLCVCVCVWLGGYDGGCGGGLRLFDVSTNSLWCRGPKTGTGVVLRPTFSVSHPGRFLAPPWGPCAQVAQTGGP